MEQPSGFWRNHERQHAARPGGLAEQRHVGRISTEGVNVLLNPLQGGYLIEQREIIDALPLFFLQRRMGKKAQMPQPVVNRHHHHVTGR